MITLTEGDVLVHGAKMLAFGAHSAVGQKRKYTGEHYFLHCDEVAEMVFERGFSDEIVAAAYLHDTVEDTEVSVEEIDAAFGYMVANLVDELTDKYTDPAIGNRTKRKQLERERLAQVSPEAQTIKYADLIINTTSIVEHDPKFAKVYMAEKKALLEVMDKGDSELYHQAKAIVEKYYAKQ